MAAITAALGSATALIIGTAPTVAAQPEPHGQGTSCPDVEVVFARGTAEPVGIGRVGQSFVNALSAQRPDRTISTYAVNYPASYDFLTTAEGATDATAHIATMALQCPSTKIVLGGYSQGAAVVDMMGGIPPLGDRIGDIGSASPLSPTNAISVVSVAVFGNPATKFGNPVTSSGLFGGRAIDLCKDGDPICSKGRNPFAHSDYESAGLTQQAANFTAGMI
jgi:cutinase